MADKINEKGLDAQELLELERQKIYKERASLYVKPQDEAVLKTLEDFRDKKFGLMVHWGLYNEIGIKEGWPLVDNEWSKWQFKPGTPNKEVKEMYAKLHRGFYPLRFDAKEWADIAYNAGFRYLCFTTKHHDGFCMWDTKTTDYKITGSEVPWRLEKNNDITKELFNAFREKNMGISLYYSRADFDCPYYWEEGYNMKDGTERIPSYDPDEKPEKWRKFQEFVYAQLKELVEGYGRIDALWFDGGCDGKKLGLPEMVDKLRKTQPWMMSVIRTGCPEYCNVITPELCVPNDPLGVPWETCTVMGKPLMEYGRNYISFGYTFDQDYMSAKEVIHLLIEIISKGGNLALNIAPQPDGRLPGRAVRELEVLSEWMKIFGDAIYATREVAPYIENKIAYTRSKDEKILNVFYLYDDGEKAPREYKAVTEKKVISAKDMRSGETLSFSQNGNCVTIILPDKLVGREGDIADCFVVELY